MPGSCHHIMITREYNVIGINQNAITASLNIFRCISKHNVSESQSRRRVRICNGLGNISQEFWQ